jgi:hypothetical protein
VDRIMEAFKRKWPMTEPQAQSIRREVAKFVEELSSIPCGQAYRHSRTARSPQSVDYPGDGCLGANLVFIAARSTADTNCTDDIFTRLNDYPSRN